MSRNYQGPYRDGDDISRPGRGVGHDNNSEYLYDDAIPQYHNKRNSTSEDFHDRSTIDILDFNPDVNSKRDLNYEDEEDEMYEDDGRQTRPTWQRILCVGSIVFIILILVFGIIFLCVWLFYRPDSPAISISNAQVGTFSVTKKNVTKAKNSLVKYTFSSMMNVTVKVDNGNKGGVDFTKMNATLGYEDTVLQDAIILGFRAEGKTKSFVTFDFSIKGLELQEDLGPIFLSSVNDGDITIWVKIFTKFDMHSFGRKTSEDKDLSCSLMINPKKLLIYDNTCNF